MTSREASDAPSAPKSVLPAPVCCYRRNRILHDLFLTSRLICTRISGVFPWRRQGGGGSPRPSAPPSPGLRPASPEAAHTAPATPVKEVRDSEAGGQYRRSPGLSKSVRHKTSSCTPLDEPMTSRSDWDIRRTWSHGHSGKDQTAASTFLSSDASSPLLSHPRLHEDKELSQSQRSISGNVSESVLQKFRKSLALKFQKRGSSREAVGDDAMEDPSSEEHPLPPAFAETQGLKDEAAVDPKFKFGPLVWRSSKERKKGKKAARNAKCNSGDSGIQLEMVAGSHTAGDSSESHDTDHLGDDEPLDEMDSPPAVRRRVNSKSSDKSSRPQSEVINQILIDKFKADLQTRAHPRHQNVRRAHSDLGGQRIFNWDVRNSYRRMFSTPSPIKMRPPRTSPPRPANTEAVNLRSYLVPWAVAWFACTDAPALAVDAVSNRARVAASRGGSGVACSSKRRASRPQLRRSISQPLGLNELSPLTRRKPCGPPATRAPSGSALSEDEHECHGGAGTSDDEMMSDSESSVASLTDRKKSFEQSMDEELAILAEAVWDHVAMEPEELAFRAGDVVEVLDTLDKDWWWGARGDHTGWFPAAFVRLRVSQEDTVEDCLAAMAAGAASVSQLRRRTSISLLSNDQVRTSVVRELVNTERDFVRVLRDVAEGYLAECKRRSDMFTPEQISTIFGNLEELLRFQSVFLEDLESHIDWEAPHRSCVGECFLNHRAGFRIYSEYCNSHPLATATLQELYQHNSYSKFFEACRLMRGLIEIPLDGYLLTPVQRICKYPLQLAELFKYTKADHPDFDKIQEALEAMRDVAVLINERKRRMESLEKLAAWQQRVEGWEGEDLIEVSSQLIHQGEVVRVTTGMWTSNITLFLFDHQLVYCKKDILKRNTYVYKGRIDLDTSEVVDVPDGKDSQLGTSARHGLKVYSRARDKWLLLCCRSAEEKAQWLGALREERELVARDLREGLEFPLAARQLARAAAKRQRRPPCKPRGKSYKRDPLIYGGGRLNPGASHPSLAASGTSHSLGRKVGTWFTFGSSKKRHMLMRSSPHHNPS
ncbi:rho guanine nucleotide exchange factor 4 isoform X2 [Bacillus rossius redtenbacheri]|uniref:rho guanine nucleotide exchange factor 4 isoform X2 n=1 Tax=Bacillus rossius redtenbacheri TaxID=93214 RepID=UPI002FDEBA67